ncbi:hypothetical protein DSCO28_59930 [Desulfosarcina ovata subsp. sediminis]|uniref:Uncharacterized protein n=1 Tax=Desulfosarcina ovata subsp. sediminis TaxID=885957 RepID=A0A5K7ZYS9_9BACT|nr:hypothetical protein DSCO28_59930 [Desulfosarcina ovata subsp. sediminis]
MFDSGEIAETMRKVGFSSVESEIVDTSMMPMWTSPKNKKVDKLARNLTLDNSNYFSYGLWCAK